MIHKGTRDREDIDVVKCQKCGVVFLSKVVTSSSLSRKYRTSVN